MVVMEELIENNLDLASHILEPLWERFHKVDNRVKGDLLYLFGLLKHTECVPQLQAILNGDYDSEVQEAAQEALANINSTNSRK
jgi:HEAT repeat protein